MRLWSLADGSCLRTFEGHQASVLRLDFLSAGTQLLSAGADGLLKLWSVRLSGAVLRRARALLAPPAGRTAPRPSVLPTRTRAAPRVRLLLCPPLPGNAVSLPSRVMACAAASLPLRQPTHMAHTSLSLPLCTRPPPPCPPPRRVHQHL